MADIAFVAIVVVLVTTRRRWLPPVADFIPVPRVVMSPLAFPLAFVLLVERHPPALARHAGADFCAALAPTLVSLSVALLICLRGPAVPARVGWVRRIFGWSLVGWGLIAAVISMAMTFVTAGSGERLPLWLAGALVGETVELAGYVCLLAALPSDVSVRRGRVSLSLSRKAAFAAVAAPVVCAAVVTLLVPHPLGGATHQTKVLVFAMFSGLIAALFVPFAAGLPGRTDVTAKTRNGTWLGVSLAGLLALGSALFGVLNPAGGGALWMMALCTPGLLAALLLWAAEGLTVAANDASIPKRPAASRRPPSRRRRRRR